MIREDLTKEDLLNHKDYIKKYCDFDLLYKDCDGGEIQQDNYQNHSLCSTYFFTSREQGEVILEYYYYHTTDRVIVNYIDYKYLDEPTEYNRQLRGYHTKDNLDYKEDEDCLNLCTEKINKDVLFKMKSILSLYVNVEEIYSECTHCELSYPTIPYSENVNIYTFYNKNGLCLLEYMYNPDTEEIEVYHTGEEPNYE